MASASSSAGVPPVSVIIPAFNSGAYIAAALDSVLAQSHRPLEIIVVDDGSTDDTAAIVKSYGESVRYIWQPNARQAAARNTGIAAARGELIAFLDADDAWLPDKLARQVAVHQSDRSLGLSYTGMRLIDRTGGSLGEIKGELAGRDGLQILLGRGSAGLGSTGVVPRSVLDEVGLFDVDLPPCEDTDLFWRIGARYPVAYVPELLTLYRLHGSNSHQNVPRTTSAWKKLYAKAMSDPHVRAQGWLFRQRCKGRLFYMLAGDHARIKHYGRAALYAAQAFANWPPAILRRLRPRRW